MDEWWEGTLADGRRGLFPGECSHKKYLVLAILTRIFQPTMLSLKSECDERLEAENGFVEYSLD